MTAFFVTGTDTGVGKTRVSAALLHALNRQHARVIGMKPVAAGTELINGEWANEDVLALRAASTVQVPALYDNPYLLNLAASPHIAAREEGVEIDIEHIAACFHALRQQADAVVVEGAGGFIVPLLESGRQSATSADLAVLLRLPVILVVGDPVAGADAGGLGGQPHRPQHGGPRCERGHVAIGPTVAHAGRLGLATAATSIGAEPGCARALNAILQNMGACPGRRAHHLPR